MKSIISTLLLLPMALSLHGQPDTEIYLFALDNIPDVGYQLSSPVNISQNEGYDNQPSFWPDGNSILYARTVDGQTEIARYYVGSGKTNIITKTLQGSEYSPTPTPDGKISSIRLDTTGLQLLYSYDLSGNSTVLVEDLVIGYHAWIEDRELATFVLGEPSTLQLINLKNSKRKTIAENIGRSLHKIPDSKFFTYVDKSGDWTIKAFNPKKGNTVELARALDGSEDYCWTPDQDILMGQGSVLWSWNREEGWKEVYDLANYGLKGITRLAISPQGDKLALVVDNN